ncbi:hypothetical protein ACFW9I_15850, partial [[Kitasatospora] papulosa]
LRASLPGVAGATPVRPSPPPRGAAVEAAMRARRTCPNCRRDAGYCIPRSLGMCVPCSDIESAA